MFLPHWFSSEHLNITQTRLAGLAVKVQSVPNLSHNKRNRTRCSQRHASRLKGPNKQADHKQKISQSKKFAKLAKTHNTTLL